MRFLPRCVRGTVVVFQVIYDRRVVQVISLNLTLPPEPFPLIPRPSPLTPRPALPAAERGQRARLSRLHRPGGGVAEPLQAQVHARRGLSRVRARAHRHRHRRGGGEGRRGSGRASRRDLAQAVLQTRSTAASATRLQPATRQQPACLHLPLPTPHCLRCHRLTDDSRDEAREAHFLTPKKARSIADPDADPEPV